MPAIYVIILTIIKEKYIVIFSVGTKEKRNTKNEEPEIKLEYTLFLSHLFKLIKVSLGRINIEC